MLWSDYETILRSLSWAEKQPAVCVCVFVCVCDECLIVSWEIYDISGAETDTLLIRGKGRWEMDEEWKDEGEDRWMDREADSCGKT